MRIVVAPNALKDCLTAQQVAARVRAGLEAALPAAEIREFPVADGGDGFLACCAPQGGAQVRRCAAQDPLGRPREAEYALVGDAAVVEIALASGIALLAQDERSATETSSFGSGQVVRHILDTHPEVARIVVGIGGSAFVDGGCGLAQALGVRFLDDADAEIPPPICGGDLQRIVRIDPAGLHPRARSVRIDAACDVTNPLLGPNGAAAVYGPQKGASLADVALLEDGLAKLATLWQRDLGVPLADTDAPGCGAAGGLGAGLVAFLGAHLRNGFQLVAETTGLAEAVKGADWVVTAEGRLDHSSLQGKGPGAVAELAARAGARTVVLAGSVAAEMARWEGAVVVCIQRGPGTLEAALAAAGDLLEDTAFTVGRLVK